MAPRTPPQDLEAAKQDPADAFENPEDVLHQEEMSYEDKLAILQRWELDARALQEATAENMGGGEDTRLRDVRLAIEQLQADAALDPSKPESAPSGGGYRPAD